MKNTEFSINVNGHLINIKSQPELKDLSGDMIVSRFNMFGITWVAEGE